MKTLLVTASLLLPAVAMAGIDPMNLMIRTTYNDEIRTVKQAADFVTEHTGYRLLVGATAPREAARIVSAPVPPIARLNRTMRISDALLVLAGNGRCLIIDQENKLFSFGEESTCEKF